MSIAKDDYGTINMKLETAFNRAKKNATGTPKQRKHQCWKAVVVTLRAIDDGSFDPLNPPV